MAAARKSPNRQNRPLWAFLAPGENPRFALLFHWIADRDGLSWDGKTLTRHSNFRSPASIALAARSLGWSWHTGNLWVARLQGLGWVSPSLTITEAGANALKARAARSRVRPLHRPVKIPREALADPDLHITDLWLIGRAAVDSAMRGKYRRNTPRTCEQLALQAHRHVKTIQRRLAVLARKGLLGLGIPLSRSYVPLRSALLLSISGVKGTRPLRVSTHGGTQPHPDDSTTLADSRAPPEAIDSLFAKIRDMTMRGRSACATSYDGALGARFDPNLTAAEYAALRRAFVGY